MARNIAQVSRKELIAHRRFVTGITADKPRYKEVDASGAKEWVVDVFLGPLELVEKNILREVPVAKIAQELVSDIRQPVLLERSAQGRYTVIGRAKEIPAGAQMPEGSILEPTFHDIRVNLADLGLLHLADLDWTLSPMSDLPEAETHQVIRAFDAFGHQVVGPEVDNPPPAYAPAPIKTVTTRHTVFVRARYGPKGHPDAMVWGQGPYQPTLAKIVELEE